MSNPMDLAQFGRWLNERQNQLMADLWREQWKAQEEMVKGLCEDLKERPEGTQGTEHCNPVQFRLSKLMGDDDIEAFLHSFEATTTAASWPRTQWVTILGPYLTGARK